MGITAANEMLNKCIRGNHSFLMNVVLLEDSTHDWSLRYVKEAVQNAIEKDYKINQAEGTHDIPYDTIRYTCLTHSDKHSHQLTHSNRQTQTHTRTHSFTHTLRPTHSCFLINNTD